MKLIACFVIAAMSLHAAVLVEGGKARATIVVLDTASPSEKRAARELQRFVEEMSGARLEIATAAKGARVLLGEAAGLDVKELGPEGFRIETRGRDLLIAGGRARGTMYGVTAFLEHLGCRWFTSEVSRIPKMKTIRVERLALKDKPYFEYREPFFSEAFEREWAARNRTNGDHSKLDAETGGKLQYYPFVHSFNELVPPERYFKDHPEYFSLIDGKRRSERSQLCLTNPEVLKVALERVEEWIEKHPEATIYSVSQNDWEGWCECDRCRRVEQEEGGAHIGPVLRFVNAVAEEVEKRHPEKLIDTLAYWYTEDPPAKVRPRKNVRIRLCPIGICTSHSFGSCPRSAYFMKNLKAWAGITNQLYIWHYNTNFSHYLLPFPDFDELRADIPLYAKNGVVGLFMQGAYAQGGGGEMSWPRSYLLARMLWNPAVDTEAVLKEFFEGVYGAAAPKMREYLELLHGEVRPGPAGRGEHLWIFLSPEYSDELVARGTKLMDEALAATPDEAVKRRIRKDRLALEYLSLLKEREYGLRGSVYAPRDLEGLKARAAAFLGRVREHGLESLHEGKGLDWDEQYWAGLKAQPAVVLENAGWRAVVAPGLNGRVVELKHDGKELLRQMPPADLLYPTTGGLSAYVSPDWHGKTLDVAWKVERATATEATIAGTVDGLRISRVFRLEADGLKTVFEVENTGASEMPVALQTRADFAAAGIDRERVRFQSTGGGLVEKRLIGEGEIPNGRATYDGAGLPAGEWGLAEAGVKSRFSGAERAVVTWSAKGRPGANLMTWTGERRLKAGEKLKMEVSYGR